MTVKERAKNLVRNNPAMFKGRELLWETILEQQFIAVQIEQLREDKKFTLEILSKH